MELVIRKMQPEEAGAVRSLGRRAFSSFESLFISKPKEALVAVIDEKLVGAALLKVIPEKGGKSVGYIDFAFVHPSYHHQGIGKRLYQEAIEYLWQRGCTHITALVKDDHVGSWGLFVKNGFERVGPMEALANLGGRGFLNQMLHTSLLWAYGMDLYLAARSGNIQKRESNSFQEIMAYLATNGILVFLMALLQGKYSPWMLTGAWLGILSLGIGASYIMTRFEQRQWNFRLLWGGFSINLLVLLIGGGICPMVGNWYPEKYEATGAFRKSMGINAIASWLSILLVAYFSYFLGTDQLFFKVLYQFSGSLLFYRIIAFYPLEALGGGRVYRWHRGIYALMVLASGLILWMDKIPLWK